MIESKSILNVKIHNFDSSLEEILEKIRSQKNVLVVTLDVHQLLKVNRNKKLREVINNASLVIAAHPSIAKAYHFLYKEKLVCIKDFLFFSNILSYIEQKKMTMFLFGNEEKYFFTIQNKIKKIYPDIQILGSFQDTKDKQELEKAFLGFKKIEPDMFLIHMPFKKSLHWIYEHKDKLSMRFCIPVSRPLDSFAGKIKSPNLKTLEENKEELFYIKRNIFRVFLKLNYIKFWILILFQKLFPKKEKKEKKVKDNNQDINNNIIVNETNNSEANNTNEVNNNISETNNINEENNNKENI